MISHHAIFILYIFSLPPVVCMMAHVLFTWFVFVCVYRCQSHIVLCFCYVVFVLLPVSLDCPFVIASSLFSNVYLCLNLLSVRKVWWYQRVIRSRESTDRQQIAILNRDNRTNDDISTKHCSEDQRLSKTQLHKNWRWTQVLRKSR